MVQPKRSWVKAERAIELTVRWGVQHGGKVFDCLRPGWRGVLTCEVQECKAPSRRQRLQVEVWVEY